MASTYTRKDSEFIYIRFKDDDGVWRGKPTGYLKANIGDRRQAKLVARKETEIERQKKPSAASDRWHAWVERWMQARYGNTQSTTHDVYKRHWRRLSDWLEENRIATPSQFLYRHIPEYREDRQDDGTANNTVIHELKFMGLVMGEAARRGMCSMNPCVRMGLKKTTPEPKTPWTDEQVRVSWAASEKEPQWIRATLLLGFYQAARMRQCEIPLTDILFDGSNGGTITYWRTIDGRPLTKGNKPFSHPIDPRAVPLLKEIVAARRAEGSKSLCDVPSGGVPAGVIYRQFLDGVGFHKISHHGLRYTWITRAALSGRNGHRGISLAEAKRFVNHGSTAVHEIYQRLSVSDLVHVPDALDLVQL